MNASAVMVIALQKPDWEVLYQKATTVSELSMSCGTLQELLIVASRKGVLTEVKALLMHLDMDYLPVTESLALKGLEFYQQYGKGGGHPAQLNYGDCFAAAITTERKLPLLYAGKDFDVAGF